MKENPRPIFRGDALRRQFQSREESVLPRFVSPPVFVCLWLLLGLFLTSGVVAWFVRLPVYVSGPAVVVASSGDTHSIRHETVVVAFLPPDDLPRLRVGQKVFLPSDRVGHRLSQSVIAVESEISSPDDAQRRFALNSGVAQVISGPSAIAITRFEHLSTNSAAAAHVGSVYRVDIEVGSRRAVSLLPLIGHFWGE